MRRLDAYRRGRGWTYDQLGDRLGRTGVQCGRYCRGESHPSLEIGQKLARLSDGAVHLGNYHDDLPEAEAKAMIARLRAADAQTAQTAGGMS
jgi:transcriptional regulator with XRE-family HTH domain